MAQSELPTAITVQCVTLIVPWTWPLSQDILVVASSLSDEAALLKDKIKGPRCTNCK